MTAWVDLQSMLKLLEWPFQRLQRAFFTFIPPLYNISRVFSEFFMTYWPLTMSLFLGIRFSRKNCINKEFNTFKNHVLRRKWLKINVLTTKPGRPVAVPLFTVMLCVRRCRQSLNGWPRIPVSQSVCLSVCLFICLSVCLSIHLSVPKNCCSRFCSRLA